jgi:hypothetical protein
MSNKHNSSAKEHFNKLIQFRQAAYGCLGQARDAMFELGDAVIQMRQVQSFAELSCAPAFRRKWPSVYEALQDGHPKRAALLQLYLKQPVREGRLVLAGDHTAWSRLWAETLAGRSYQHQPDPMPGHRPVTLGHGYSTLAVVPETQGSWALPLLHERITNQKPVESGAHQLRQTCSLLSVRPISLWDSEYGCAAFLLATADVKADKLIRLRTNLCLEGATKPRTSSRGTAPKHGVKFKFKDPTTWWEADQVQEYTDPVFGPLTVRIWKGLRFSKALECRMTVVQVERKQASDSRRQPRLLWFGWVGEEPPEHWWNLYGRRYPVDHWYRFAKGRLHWTLPRLATPEQAERWSDLMPLLTWELWLARDIVQDSPLPWQKAQANLSPARVCQGMQNILVAIGTPTRACKTRGNSPGWPAGQPRTHRKPQEIIRSEQWKTIRAHKQSVSPGQTPKRGRPKKDLTSTHA